jgi:microcystin-dependent protein
MTSFTRNWTDAYVGLPPNEEDARKGAGRIRDLKVDIQERMKADHRWHGDDNDGYHQQVSMLPLASDPSAADGVGRLYVKRVGNDIELRYISEDGTITQLTSTSSPANSYVAPGTIIMVGNSLTIDNMLPAYIDCNGQAVSRTTYPGLFQAIGTLWGVGDSVNTFNVPDMRGRVPVAAGTGAGLTNRAVTALFGEERHSLLIAELPDHIHSIAVSTNPYAAPGVLGYQVTDVQTGIGGTGPNPALTGTPHNVMQPSVAVRFVIKT